MTQIIGILYTCSPLLTVPGCKSGTWSSKGKWTTILFCLSALATAVRALNASPFREPLSFLSSTGFYAGYRVEGLRARDLMQGVSGLPRVFRMKAYDGPRLK